MFAAALPPCQPHRGARDFLLPSRLYVARFRTDVRPMLACALVCFRIALPWLGLLSLGLAASHLGGCCSPQDHIPQQDFSGLLDLFEMALPGLLLYRFERPQFADLYHDNPKRRWSKVYGAMHLLRLVGMACHDAR